MNDNITKVDTSIDDLLWFLNVEHLPEELAAIGRPFTNLAMRMADELPDCRELRRAFRYLLYAQNLAVRTKINS